MTFNKIIKLNYKKIQKGRCFVVSEISANHSGNLKNAFKLIKLSKKNGADFVKFQTYEKNSMTLSNDNKEFVIKDGIWKNKRLWSLYENAQTPFSWQKKLFDTATKEKIKAFKNLFSNSY